MIQIKSELQAHFHSITDMSNHIRTLVSKYSPLVTSIKFENIGRPSERAIIQMNGSNAVIILDWNILALIKMDITEGFSKNESAIKIFNELLDDISESEFFNGLKMSRVLMWDLYDDKSLDIESFKDSYLKVNLNKTTVNDISITVEGEINSRIEYALIFGPYNFEDIKKHNLSLEGYYPESLMNASGLLVNTLVTDKLNNKFSSLLNKVSSTKQEIHNKILIK